MLGYSAETVVDWLSLRGRLTEVSPSFIGWLPEVKVDTDWLACRSMFSEASCSKKEVFATSHYRSYIPVFSEVKGDFFFLMLNPNQYTSLSLVLNCG